MEQSETMDTQSSGEVIECWDIESLGTTFNLTPRHQQLAMCLLGGRVEDFSQGTLRQPLRIMLQIQLRAQNVIQSHHPMLKSAVDELIHVLWTFNWLFNASSSNRNREPRNLRKALPQKKPKYLEKKIKRARRKLRKSRVQRRKLQNKSIINILRQIREGILTSKQGQDVLRKEYSKN